MTEGKRLDGLRDPAETGPGRWTAGAVVLILLGLAWTSVPAETPGGEGSPRKANYTRFDVLVAYHDSHRYESDLRLIYQQATEYVQMRAAERKAAGPAAAARERKEDEGGESGSGTGPTVVPDEGEAEKARAEKPGKHGPERLAVVMEVDETLLSNWDELHKSRFTDFPGHWPTWIREKKGKVIPEALAFFKAARKCGVDVFLVSSRPRSLEKETKETLLARGVGDWTGLVMKPDATPLSLAQYKAGARKSIEADGYVIIVNVSSQECDLAGGFAEKTFKLPNPFYRLQ